MVFTIFIAQKHNPFHVLCVIDDVGRQVFDKNTDIWTLFDF